MRIAVAIDLPPTATYHRATIDAIGHAAGALGCAVDVDVRNTDAAGFDDLSGVDGLVIGPGSPYRDEPAENAAERERQDRISAAMSALTPKQREVLELGYFGGLSQSEIAARLGTPLGTVKSWTRQGLMRLRELVPAGEMT